MSKCLVHRFDAVFAHLLIFRRKASIKVLCVSDEHLPQMYILFAIALSLLSLWMALSVVPGKSDTTLLLVFVELAVVRGTIHLLLYSGIVSLNMM
jgi:hypothetical protein